MRLFGRRAARRARQVGAAVTALPSAAPSQLADAVPDAQLAWEPGPDRRAAPPLARRPAIQPLPAEPVTWTATTDEQTVPFAIAPAPAPVEAFEPGPAAPNVATIPRTAPVPAVRRPNLVARVGLPRRIGPRVELGFRDGSTAALDPSSHEARALDELARDLVRPG